MGETGEPREMSYSAPERESCVRECPRNVGVRPNLVDYRDETGTYYVYDIYRGLGLEGIERGTVKKLRVVGLDFRAAGIGSNVNRGRLFGRAKLSKRATTRLRGTAAQIATDLSPVSAVLLRARVAVPVQVAATSVRAPD